MPGFLASASIARGGRSNTSMSLASDAAWCMAGQVLRSNGGGSING